MDEGAEVNGVALVGVPVRMKWVLFPVDEGGAGKWNCSGGGASEE